MPEPEPPLDPNGRVKELLTAYLSVLERVDQLPWLIWMPWSRTGPGRFLKVPYLRWFLRFFVAHHIRRSLGALGRRLYAVAALSDDPDTNKASREAIKLFDQSLPAPPYRTLIFAVILAALLIALPLQRYGNVFYVLDLVGALLRVDVSYAGRAFADKELVPTVRSLLVLVVGLLAVGALLTSPFGLKRALFNLYPWRREDLTSTAAYTHGHRSEGVYALEDQVFRETGTTRPQEGRWDLAFQTFLWSILVLLEIALIVITLAAYLQWIVQVNVDLSGGEEVPTVILPDLPWFAYALLTALVFVLCALLGWRLAGAWRSRSRRRTATVAPPAARPS